MTLLLAARTKDHVAVLADGLSFSANGDGVSVQRENLPKLFAIERLPVVIAHHGQNKLGGIDVHQFVQSQPFQRTVQREWQRGLNPVIGRVILEFDTTVTQTLESSDLRREFGLWFVGLWPCTDMPEIVELLWHNISPVGQESAAIRWATSHSAVPARSTYVSTCLKPAKRRSINSLMENPKQR